MNIRFLAVPLCTVLLFYCGHELKESRFLSSTDHFVQPPLPNVNIPFQDYSVEAEVGDTLFYPTGSIIVMPPNAFVDKAGNIIKGTVQVKYREFMDPLDFFIAGIPMNYDSAGTKYAFESSGMCEIVAYKNGVPVYVNPRSKPVINMASGDNSPAHSLYYLDTVQRTWIYRGVSTPTEIKNANSKLNRGELANYDLEKPIKPVKANMNTPVIQIEVDPNSFKELMAYNNMLFQVEPNEKSFDAKDSLNEWSNVKLKRTNQYGVYRVTFSNANTTVSYLARPVFEGKNYDKALKVFEQKSREYKKQLNDRLAKEKNNSKKYIADSLANEKVVKENLRIEPINKENRAKYIKDSLAYEKVLEENKRIAKLNVLIEARNKERQKQVVQFDSMMNRMFIPINEKEYNQANAIYRSFEIDGFGVYNCDRAANLKSFPIAANFADSTGKLLNLSYISVIYSAFNGIVRFSDNNIQLSEESRNMILGIHDGKIAYTIYKYPGGNRNNSDETIFVMSQLPVSEENYKYVRGLIDTP